MRSWYLWCGVGAIEDLEGVQERADAIELLKAKFGADWTLWERNGDRAILLGVKGRDGHWAEFS
jgi:hypothetical protein